MMEDAEVKTYKLGTRVVRFPSAELQPLEDCNHLLGDREALMRELHEKGYLFVRGLHDREEVLNGRLAVLEHILAEGKDKLDLTKNWQEGLLDLSYLLIRGMHEREDVLEARLCVLEAFKKLGPNKLDASHPWQAGVLDQRCGQDCFPSLQGKNDITHSEAIGKVLEGPRPFAFFKTLFGEDARTFDYKWLRAVHRQAFTGAHVDNVYMARGTSNLYTMWTPFGDVDPYIGCLAVCEGSNNIPGFDKLHETYSQVDVEEINLNGSGWFTTDPFEITEKFGGQWKTTNFKAGDVLIFGMKTVHMSTANQTDLVRISCDTRWQPASEPADPRYVGDLKPLPKFGLHSKDGEAKPKTVTMEELKFKWGLQ